MKKMLRAKKILKTLFISFLIIVLLLGISAYIITLPIGNYSLDEQKLSLYKPSLNFYDIKENNITKEFISNNNYITIDKLPAYVPQAFIDIEDKRFCLSQSK